MTHVTDVLCIMKDRRLLILAVHSWFDDDQAQKTHILNPLTFILSREMIQFVSLWNTMKQSELWVLWSITSSSSLLKGDCF